MADPFRWAEVRRVERELIAEFEEAIAVLIEHLSPERLHRAVEIAELPDQVRGYEDLKLRRAAAYSGELRDALADYRTESFS